MAVAFNSEQERRPERACKQAHQRARTPRERQGDAISSAGIPSGSSGEGSRPPLANQLSFPSFCREEMLSYSVSPLAMTGIALLVLGLVYWFLSIRKA